LEQQKLELINHYFEEIRKLLLSDNVKDKIIEAVKLVEVTGKSNKKILFFGNGASAAIASHAALDFTKQANIRSVALSDFALITAFSNDYGYENWICNAIDFYAEDRDMCIFISSSGESENIVKGALEAKKRGLAIITFTGFSEENRLKQIGNINFWVRSKAYNVIESIHQMWLMCICDVVIGRLHYKTKSMR